MVEAASSTEIIRQLYSPCRAFDWRNEVANPTSSSTAGEDDPSPIQPPSPAAHNRKEDSPWLMASAPVRSSKTDLPSRSPKPTPAAPRPEPGVYSTMLAASHSSSAPSVPPTTASTASRWLFEPARVEKG